jgi:putative peptidoglycan lipid II flippase
MRTALEQLLEASRSLRSSPLLRDTAVTTGFNILGKAIGFAIPFFIAAWFGVGPKTDAFFFAYGLVLLLAGIFFPVVEAVIVPFVAEIRARNESEVRPFLGAALVASIAGLAVLGGLCFAISRPVLSVVSHFPSDSLDLISRLLLETSPLLLLLVCTSLVSGVLNAYKFFSLPAFSPAIRAVVAIAVIFALKGRIGVHSIALGYVAGEFVRFISLLGYAARRRIAPSISSIKPDTRVFEFLKTASYQVIGMAVLVFNPVVDKTMASWLAPGSVSILEYSDRLYEVPITLITRGLFVVLLSHWSISFYEVARAGIDRKSDLRRNAVRTAALTGVGAAAISAVLILLRGPLVGLVYGHGQFNAEYLPAVQGVWSLYLVGLGPSVVGWVFARAHLVLKNTRLLMLSGIICSLLNVVFNLALIKPLGLYGLALSTTITYAVVAVVLGVSFLRRVR